MRKNAGDDHLLQQQMDDAGIARPASGSRQTDHIHCFRGSIRKIQLLFNAVFIFLVHSFKLIYFIFPVIVK